MGGGRKEGKGWVVNGNERRGREVQGKEEEEGMNLQ